MSRVVLATLRNEAPFLLQWIAWHRMIGFDAFLIYTNDCDDQSEAMLARLQDMGLVTWVQNEARFGGGPQMKALADAMQHPVYRDAEWVAHFDLDEFLVVHAGDGRLQALLDRSGNANMVSVTWRNFGDSGMMSYRDGLLVEQFTWCAPRYLQRPRQLTAIKTLHRPLGLWEAIGPHRPFRLNAPDDQVVWVNGDGDPMPKSFLKVGWQSEPGFFGDSLAQLNHYAIKTGESFLTKVARGSPRTGKQHVDFSYWCLRNINFEQDLTAQRNLPAYRDAVQDLLSDRILGPLQTEAVQEHRTRIEQLLSMPEYRALHDRIATHVPHGTYTRALDGDREVYSFSLPDVPEPQRVM